MNPSLTNRNALFRVIFALAAIYNIGFAIWLGFQPDAIFALFNIPQPVPSYLLRVLAVIIGVFGVGYAYATSRPDRAGPIIAVGLLSKIAPPIAWIFAVSCGQWPLRTFLMILCNDILWWMPFFLFLRQWRRSANDQSRPQQNHDSVL